MEYFIILNYGNVKKKKKPKILISHHLNFITFLNNVMLYFCIDIILM